MRIVWGLSLFLVWSACSEKPGGSYRSKKTDSIATRETAENVTIEYTDSGILKAIVESPEMIGVKNVRNPYIEMPKGIRAEFLDLNGNIESYLLSEYGISYTEQKRMVVRRNVRVLNMKCEKLETEELIWDQQKGRIYTDKFVKITTPDQIITGEGMESDQTFSDWEILNVNGTINRKKNDTLPCNESLVPRRSRRSRH
jgi:LPS export ABC transporter protein LptC